MMNKVLKWILILCTASSVVNAILYGVTGSMDRLISLFGGAGMGVLAAIILLFNRKKQ
ncbi:hypothetical protein RE628_27960 [Paenibacillus sp. D2_2]|uniref:hypothetical protein n=1 Tax=Paenibacillus sp. D2_2 TaxID=3073092 RepID=UPI00281591CB|nr:hypothetical protein [Paenibacillus sp. D2_2]WMT40875.1 hypothetical protein RE628_27960 [Paenibacillus sp. D2_2]